MIRRLGWRWQIGLRTMILLVVAVALGLNIARERDTIPELRGRLQGLQSSRPSDLRIIDPAAIAAQKNDSPWTDEDSWQVYLPLGGRYRLCLATRVGSVDDQPSRVESVEIEPGRHMVSVDRQRIGLGWRITATWNQKDRLQLDEPGNWLDRTGGWGWTNEIPDRLHVPLGRPVLLAYTRYFTMKAPLAPVLPSPSVEVPGLKLWIETEAAPPPAP